MCHLFALDLESVIVVAHEDKVFQDGGVRGHSNSPSDQNGHIVTIPILLACSERTVHIQLQNINKQCEKKMCKKRNQSYKDVCKQWVR